MTISALPSAPLITDTPAVFDSKSSTFVSSLSTLVTEMNAAISAVNMTKWISGTTYAVGDVTWSPADFQAYRRKTAGAGTTDPSADTTNWQRTEVSATTLQNQNATAFTTAGTSTAFTLTPTPASAANTTNQRFMVTLNAAPTGSPTLAVSGQAALNFKYFAAAGTKQFVTSAVAPSGYKCDVVNDGTDWVLLNPIQGKTVAPAQITGTVPVTASTTTDFSTTFTAPSDGYVVFHGSWNNNSTTGLGVANEQLIINGSNVASDAAAGSSSWASFGSTFVSAGTAVTATIRTIVTTALSGQVFVRGIAYFLPA